MSQKKRKAHRVKRKKPTINPMMMNMLFGQDKKKYEAKRKDAEKIEDLIVDGVLDPYQIEDYKHIKAAARTLNWSAHKMFQAIEFADVASVIKNEQDQITVPETVLPSGDTGTEKSKG